MSLRQVGRLLGIFSIAGTWLFSSSSNAFGDGFDACCNKCPPAYVHCQEGGPRIKFKRACPKPVCNPCTLPHYGYYATCWHTWPFPQDLSHCSVPERGDCDGAPKMISPPPAKPVPLPKTEKAPLPKAENNSSPYGVKPMPTLPPAQKKQ